MMMNFNRQSADTTSSTFISCRASRKEPQSSPTLKKSAADKSQVDIDSGFCRPVPTILINDVKSTNPNTVISDIVEYLS